MYRIVFSTSSCKGGGEEGGKEGAREGERDGGSVK